MTILTGKKLVLDYFSLGIQKYLHCTIPVGFVWRKEQNLINFDKIKSRNQQPKINHFFQSLDFVKDFFKQLCGQPLWRGAGFDFVEEEKIISSKQLPLCEEKRKRKRAIFVEFCSFWPLWRYLWVKTQGILLEDKLFL